ncbi:MAG: DUF6544 family protein [Chitinophagaceae bacterium]
MIYFLISTIVFILLLILAMWLFVHFHYKKNVASLFSNLHFSEKIYEEKILSGLPAPVQRYFKHVLKPGQKYISCARLKHSGMFKSSDKDKFEKIKGEQYFTSVSPGFIWKGKTSLFTAIDMYLHCKGQLSVYLFSFLRILHGKGITYDQGELLRWLGESTWCPTNLLPAENLSWTAIDDRSANLLYKINELELSYKVFFNKENEIVSMQTKRYKGKEELQDWIGHFSVYKEMYGMIIPTLLEGAWIVQDEEQPYAIFEVDMIEFDVAEKF